MRLLLQNLDQNTLYLVQLRTKAGSQTSDWSRMFELPTDRDLVKPNPVTGLVGVMSEGNLSLVWERPGFNEDGTPFDDLRDYEVVIGPIPEDPEWPLQTFYVEGARANFPKEVNVASFGSYRSNLTVTVRVRDVVGNFSAPTTITIAKSRPQAPTNLVWGPVGTSFVGSWDAPTANLDGSAFTDLDGFDVRVIYDTNNIRVYSVPDNKFSFSYEQNKAAFAGQARATLTLEVRARDSVGQLSDPIIVESINPPPSPPTSVTASPSLDGIRVKWVEPTDDDVIHYEIWSAGTVGEVGQMFAIVAAPATEWFHETVAYSQDHYIYVKAVDTFGSSSVESNRAGPVRPKSPFGVDGTPPAQPTSLTAATSIRTQAEPSAIDLSWPAVNEDDLGGYHIRYSRDITPRVWEYHDVINSADTSAVITPLASGILYVAQIRSYDRAINTSTWSAEASATSSESVVAIGDIASDISIITGGVLRSENYDEVAGTGWRLMHSGLDIQSGTVNARVIRTGELRSTQNVTTDGTTQPAWSLNLEGNMAINSARVRGKVVVGDPAGTANGAVSIASHNYGVSGTGSQWAIKADGTIDLRQGGETSSNLTIDSTGIRGRDGAGTQRIILNTSGQFLLSTTNGGVQFDDNGLRLYSGATVVVDLNRSGAATFTGRVSAASGNIGGWAIDSAGISGGSLSLRGDLGMIFSGSTTSRVAMRAGYGFWAGAENSWDNPPFSVNPAGRLISRSGNIGGFEINSNAGLYSGSGTSRVMMQPGAGFWTGADSQGSSPWYVRADGYMFARAGRIGGWNMTDTSLTSQSGGVSMNGQSGTITGLELTGGTVQTAPAGSSRVRLIDTDKDAIQWLESNGTIRGEIRSILGVGGYGLYLNSTLQVGNSNSLIYQVGRRVANNPSTQVRMGTTTAICDGSGGYTASFGNGGNLPVAPGVVVAVLGQSQHSGYNLFPITVTNWTNTGFSGRLQLMITGGSVGNPGLNSQIAVRFYAEGASGPST